MAEATESSGVEIGEIKVDKDEFMRYLNGEIQFAQWKQGQDLLNFFASDDNAPEPMELKDGEMDENASEGSDEEDDEDDEREAEAEPEAGQEEEAGEEGEEQLDVKDEEYFPPGASVRKGKVGRPRKPRPEQVTPKRPRGRPRKRGPWLTSSSEDSPMAHELRLGQEERRQKGKRGAPRGQKRDRVPKDLRGLMGEARLCFARGKKQEAIMMCLEIIRQAPRCPDPYQLLAMIYEDKEDMERSLQFSLIAAHLRPRDTEEWTRCAEMSLDQDDIQQAIRCYSKAIRYNPKELSNHMERIQLYEQLKDSKKVIECYQILLRALPEDQGEQYMQLAKDLVKAHHQNGDIASAVEILSLAFSKHPKLISSEDVNMLAELHIASRQYQQALRTISDHCGVGLQSKSSQEALNLEQLSLADREPGQVHVEVPDGLPIDLRAKLGVCLIHCKQFQSAKEVVSLLLTKDANAMGDLFLDAAEAYIEMGCYTESLPLLRALVETENYNLAAVWLRYAESLTSLGQLEQSAMAYRQVLLKAPGHLDARIALSSIEQQQGNSDVALELLSTGSDDRITPDVQLIWQRSMLLYSRGLLQEFTRDGLKLLNAYLTQAPEKTVTPSKSLCGNLGLISHDNWFSLYCKTIDALIQRGQLDEAEELSSSILASKRFTRDSAQQLDVEVMGVCIYFLNSKYRRVYDEMRRLVPKHSKSAAVWNLFSFATNLTNDTRHHKFCLRLTLKKLHQNFALCIFNGHNAMVSGTFKNAIGEYMRGFRQKPNDPFLTFMIAICICHIACQKYTTKRHSLIVQAFAFLKRYEELRGVSQETCYNIGRAFHELGLLHMALRYYHKGLDLPPSGDDPRFDLRAELAFNLSLIYRHSGNEEMAIQLLSNSVI